MYGGHPYHHIGMPGTVMLRESVVEETLVDVMLGLWNDGFRKMVIVNNHGHLWMLETALHKFLKRYQVPAVARVIDWHVSVKDFFRTTEQGGWWDTPFIHADEAETSLGLLLFPEMVDMEQAVETETKQYMPLGHFNNSVDGYHRPQRWSQAEGHFAIEFFGTPEGVVGKPTHAAAWKAKRPVAAFCKYLTMIVDDILATFPPGRRRRSKRPPSARRPTWSPSCASRSARAGSRSSRCPGSASTEADGRHERSCLEGGCGVSWPACFCTASGPTGFGPMLFPGRVREAAQASRELGFEGIEIAMRAPEELERRELETLLRETGLRLAALGSGRSFFEDGLSLTDADDGGRAWAVARVVDLAEYAAAFDVPLVIGLVRGKAPADGDLDAALERFVASLRECLERTATSGSRFLIEAINRYETPLLTTAAETVAVVERLGSPRVAVLLDAFHMNIEEVSLGEAIRATGARLGHFHIVDSNRRAGGMGHVDFAEVAAALHEIDYEGWLSAEILPLPDDRAAAEQARRFAVAMNEEPIPRFDREGRDNG